MKGKNIFFGKTFKHLNRHKYLVRHKPWIGKNIFQVRITANFDSFV